MNTSHVSFNQPTRLPLNREVTVTSVYFRPGRSVKGFPKRMEYEGREYTFIESGKPAIFSREAYIMRGVPSKMRPHPTLNSVSPVNIKSSCRL